MLDGVPVRMTHPAKPQREIAAMFEVATGKTVGVQQENVRRGIQEDWKLAKLISAIETEIEKKSEHNY